MEVFSRYFKDTVIQRKFGGNISNDTEEIEAHDDIDDIDQSSDQNTCADYSISSLPSV